MEGAAGGSFLSMVFLFVPVMAVFYFLIIMPAKKQQKKKDAMIAGLKKGDRVVTSGGIFGTVATVEDQALLLKVSENTKIRVSKNAVAGLVGADGAPSDG
jgi:preprotein translocase subunit YajC